MELALFTFYLERTNARKKLLGTFLPYHDLICLDDSNSWNLNKVVKVVNKVISLLSVSPRKTFDGKGRLR